MCQSKICIAASSYLIFGTTWIRARRGALLTTKNFGENIKSNIKLRKLYKERVQYAVDGKKVNIKNVLVGVKLIEEEEDDGDEGEIDTIF